jgi:type IV pilus assembly protein PilW
MKHLLKHLRVKKASIGIRIGNDGFSVVELVVALGVMLMVMVGIISLFTSLNRTYTTQNAAAAVQQVTRTGIDIMTRNIRMAGFNPLNKNPIGIIEASSEKIVSSATWMAAAR